MNTCNSINKYIVYVVFGHIPNKNQLFLYHKLCIDIDINTKFLFNIIPFLVTHLVDCDSGKCLRTNHKK